ncbi:2'-5' RNA ligase family protein [Argonema galeatum]|uniref:2'-5' RNA ligase family protein n=1 Tax=Argonema galeatum TaxID=2942762 RepID=UPI0020113F5C|nr:2'-5' RNA ligase family protein [Argonema galeatum]MCL1464949.1 hypothetical protein [Argonema galeatum A003/A1]
MFELNRYAVFALLDSRSVSPVQNDQRRLTSITGNHMAFGFPVHITLRGRFRAEEYVVAKAFVKAFKEINRTALNVQTDICLSEPIYIKPDLVWLEVLPQYRGYETLLYLHRFFEQIVSEAVVEDEIPETYKYSGFRPHVTLGWGVTPQAWEEFFSIAPATLKQSRIGSIALVRYPHSWPEEEAVNVILEIPLSDRSKSYPSDLSGKRLLKHLPVHRRLRCSSPSWRGKPVVWQGRSNQGI